MTVPMLDIADGDGLRNAFRSIGFAAVTGHGIPREHFAEMRSALVELFELPAATKESLQITPTNYRGFIPLGFFTPNRAEVSGHAPDLYEGYKLHWECPPDHPAGSECELYGPNRWPEELPHLQSVVSRYWQACDRVAAQLLDVFARDLGVEATTLRSWHEAPLTNMTLLHYPPQPPNSAGAGIHPHKDTNVITLLHPDPVGGLQVQANDGQWLDVDAPPEALVINSGEMLELWSAGEYPATPHRVINRTGKHRYSFPYFLVPNHDVVVRPLKPTSSGFSAEPMPVGALSAEVWRTNWPDQVSTGAHDLGSLR